MGKAQKVAEAEKVHGIERAKLDEGSIDAALEKLDVKPSSKATLEDKVRLLVEEFEGQEKSGVKMADCDNCDAASDATAFEACPFCGVGEEGDAAPEPSEPPEDSGELPPDEDGPGDPDDAESKFAGPATDEPEGTVIDDPAALAAAAPTEEPERKAPSTKRKKKGGGERVASAQPEEVQIAAVVDIGDKLRELSALAIVAPDDAVEGVVETPLDARVHEIKLLMRMSGASSWMLAQKVKDLDISGLWKTRRTEDGKVRYKNFDEFVKAEIGETRRWWQDLVLTASRFPEGIYRELGPTKLRVALQVDASLTDEVIAKLKAGATRREIESEYLGRQNADSQGWSRNRKAKRDGQKPKADTKPRADGKVTVALVFGKVKVPFFQKATRKEIEADGGKPVKKIVEGSWCSYPLRNDAELLVTMQQNAKGEWVAIFEPRRVDPAGK